MLVYKLILLNKYLYSTFCIPSPEIHTEDAGVIEAWICPQGVLRHACRETLQIDMISAKERAQEYGPGDWRKAFSETLKA